MRPAALLDLAAVNAKYLLRREADPIMVFFRGHLRSAQNLLTPSWVLAANFTQHMALVRSASTEMAYASYIASKRSRIGCDSDIRGG